MWPEPHEACLPYGMESEEVLQQTDLTIGHLSTNGQEICLHDVNSEQAMYLSETPQNCTLVRIQARGIMQESGTNYPYNSSQLAALPASMLPKKGRGGSLQTAPSRKPDATSSGFLCTTHGCRDSLLLSHTNSGSGETDEVDGR